MSTRADDLVDRRRLRRKLTFWRAAALLVLVLAIAATARWLFGDTLAAGPHIAQVRIEGTILEDRELLDLIKDLQETDAVEGVIVTVDSPGGTTAGGEAIFDALRRLAAEKPVVAQVGTLAASAGYMVASAADFIVARQTSIVGSIGVIIQYPEVTELLDKLGIKVEEVKSSPLKAEPSPFNPTTEEERQMLASMISDSYDWFVDLVSERRKLPREDVLALADGSIFTGRQALERKLVDALGGEREAQAWLTEQGLSGDLEVVEWKPEGSGGSFLLPGAAIRWIAAVLGLPQEGAFLNRLGMEHIFLDGLVSLWQPEAGFQE
ncbi:signal peptide peptidase SppA [Chelativorans sp. AA-79]|uniref:signal peptide peptidase SppA n=1 Tax=Chelativorans sp. AA-79 TaxID=3028735 RepID=UPI0023F9C94B|nr:signal peptide peptidase SppA [Chelativorans sp. AA-79]WEX09552.1 signal peptide peptidase SppA [Chelativorans sp. AA-79]